MIKRILSIYLILTTFCYAQSTPNATVINNAKANWNYYINFVSWGDSLTSGNEDATGISYPGVLYILLPHHTFYIKGFPGFTSSQILTQFQSGQVYYPIFNIIWSGRNDWPSGFPNTLSNITTMTNSLYLNRFLVLSIINGNDPGEQKGNTNYNNLITLNSNLSSQYGNSYLDVRSYLVSQYNPSSPEDVIDHANDVVPTSLRAADISGSITQNITSSTTDFTVSATNVTPGDTYYIGTEIVYIISVGTNEVTNCTRGYAGSTAQSFSNGQTFTGVDYQHPNAAGYILIANYIKNWLILNSIFSN